MISKKSAICLGMEWVKKRYLKRKKLKEYHLTKKGLRVTDV